MTRDALDSLIREHQEAWVTLFRLNLKSKLDYWPEIEEKERHIQRLKEMREYQTTGGQG